jgi:PST family polysaccharide transporter
VQSGRARLFGNIGWLFADRVVRMGVGLLVGVWVARYLGPSDFGLLNYVMAVTALFVTIGALGLNDIVVRDLVSTPEDSGEIIGTAMRLQLLGGAVAFVTAMVAIVVMRPGEPQTWAIMALFAISLLGQSGDTIRAWFESRVQARTVVWVANGVFAGATALRVVGILAGLPLAWFALLSGLELLLTSVGLVLAIRRAARGTPAAMAHWRFSRRRAVRMLQNSWPLALSGIAITLNMRIDQVMLGQLLDDKAVGLFSAAVRVSEVWYFMPVAIVASAFPFIAGQSDQAVADRRWRQLYAGMFWLSVAAGVFATLFGESVIRLLFGDAYAPAGAILVIHIWSGFNVALGLVWSRWIVLENQPRIQLAVQTLGALVNIGLNLLLIPRLGVIGAAWATLASYWISGLFSFVIYKPRVTFGYLAAGLTPWRLLA